MIKPLNVAVEAATHKDRLSRHYLLESFISKFNSRFSNFRFFIHGSRFASQGSADTIQHLRMSSYETAVTNQQLLTSIHQSRITSHFLEVLWDAAHKHKRNKISTSNSPSKTR
jgi:hypothetical protein